MKKFLWVLFIPLGIVLLAFGVYVFVTRLGMPVVGEKPAGFWLGLWQGLIIILSFIATWFDKNITLYQAGNNGFWYNLGYILGACIALGGSRGASKSKTKKTTSDNCT